MNKWFLYISLSSVLISFLSSLNAFRLDLPKPFKQFSLFLLFVFLAEVFGVAWAKKLYQFTNFSRSNQWFYNLFHFCCYLFYLYFFNQVIQFPRIKKWIRGLSLFFVLFAAGNLLFFQGPLHLNTYTELVACLIVIFLCIAYYFELLHNNEIISLKSDLVFWISTGLLIYHLGSFMGLLLINVMNMISLAKARSILLIIQSSAIIMYLTISTGFICSRKK